MKYFITILLLVFFTCNQINSMTQLENFVDKALSLLGIEDEEQKTIVQIEELEKQIVRARKNYLLKTEVAKNLATIPLYKKLVALTENMPNSKYPLYVSTLHNLNELEETAKTTLVNVERQKALRNEIKRLKGCNDIAQLRTTYEELIKICPNIEKQSKYKNKVLMLKKESIQKKELEKNDLNIQTLTVAIQATNSINNLSEFDRYNKLSKLFEERALSYKKDLEKYKNHYEYDLKKSKEYLLGALAHAPNEQTRNQLTTTIRHQVS